MAAVPTARWNETAPRLDELVRACARDERPALEALYRETVQELYGLAMAATKPALAEQAVIRSYLDAFSEAGSVDPATVEPRVWLKSLLARHLPEGRQSLDAASPAPLAPPGELWQRLDIALGLRRLDQHIKPGVATEERGRDPMPNHQDRRRDRRLAFWRGTAMTSLGGLALAVAVILAPGLRQGISQQPPGDSAQLAETQAVASPSWRTAILQPRGERRFWRVDFDTDKLVVSALPAFSHAGDGVLALWGRDGPDGPAHHLGNLDPRETGEHALPADLIGADIDLAITLERAATSSAPEGPILFSGRLER